MRVMIIEDYEPLTLLLAALCESLGNQVSVVHTLNEAWIQLKLPPRCELVFLDLTLRDAGPETAINALPEMKSMADKIVIITGNPKSELVGSALSYGADDYVSKNSANFVDVIKSYMANSDYSRLTSTRGD